MGDLDMKLPTFKSLDEKMKSMANEVFPPLHPAWSGENNQAYQDGFESGVIERDKQWQSKVSKLLEFMERLTNTDICSTQPDVVWLSNWRNQAKTQAKNVLAEFYGEEKND